MSCFKIDREGFTLVEAALVAVVITVILAVSIPWMGEQHNERERARLQGLAETEPWEVFDFRVKPSKEAFLDGEDIVIECEIVNLTRHPLAWPDPSHEAGHFLIFGNYDHIAGSSVTESLAEGTIITPRESAKIEASFLTKWVGAAEVFIVSLMDDDHRFRSNSFRLVINNFDGSTPTVDEVIAKAERSRIEIAEPWRVFEFRAEPAKSSFLGHEDIVVLCEIVNTTRHKVDSPWRFIWILLTVEDTGLYVGAEYGFNEWAASLEDAFLLDRSPLSPMERRSFELRFSPVGAGSAEMRISMAPQDSLPVPPAPPPPAVGKIGPEVLLFQSNAFEITVEPNDDTVLQTFDQIIDDMGKEEATRR